MLEGDMCLEIYEGGKPRSVVIREGEIFLLAGNIPHSPQRKAGTVGLVLERERAPGEIDGLRWYTPDASRILYEESFHCTDLGVQLKPVIERFFASDCCKSGVPERDFEAASPVAVDPHRRVGDPINLRAWVAEHAAAGNVVLYGPGATDADRAAHEYCIEVKTARDAAWEGSSSDSFITPAAGKEVLFYQLDGTSQLRVRDSSSGTVHEWPLGPDSMFLLPATGTYSVQARFAEGGLCLVATNSVAATSGSGASAPAAAS